MILNQDNTRAYLKARNLLPASYAENSCSVEELEGGYLNRVIRVRTPDQSLVIKQSLERLKAFPELRVTTDRLVFERRSLELIAELLPQAPTPRVLDFDDEHHVLIMSDLGKGPRLEDELLHGRVNLKVAKKLGQFIVKLHNRTSHNPELRARFDNREMHQLRLQHGFFFVDDATLMPAIKRLADTFTTSKVALLHGDFWTASVLVLNDRIGVYDLEFANYGDPAQDVGFMLAHYLLHYCNNPELEKRIADAVLFFWTTYLEQTEYDDKKRLEQNVLGQIGVEMLFRVDGLNKVRYITHESSRQRVRNLVQRLLAGQIKRLPAIFT